MTRLERFARFFVVAVLVIAAVLSLSSCGIDKDEAKEDMLSFLEAVEAERFDDAKALLHPELIEKTTDFATAIHSLEERCGIDFSDGITINKTVNMQYSLYNSDYNGSGYELTFYATVGEADVYITLRVVENNDGYGVYYFGVDNG